MSEGERRSLGCARCGDCCEDVYLGVSLESLLPWTTETLKDTPDPRTDDGWRWWISDERGHAAWPDTTGSREQAIFLYDPDGDRRRNADFLTQHWSESKRDATDTPQYRCAKFNAETRLCEAHDERPPVCTGYPWYQRGPRPDVIRTNLHCSYLLDLPPADRPEGARPLIPVEVLRG